MNRRALISCVTWLCVASFSGNPAAAQSLELRWKKDFAKGISWYVRTSPGILLVKSGKSLTAVDGQDGRELWEFPKSQNGEKAGAITGVQERGQNLLEVPGMGVLLVNGVKLPGNSERRLMALNLMTGERLWDEPALDDLMTAIPLYDGGQIVVVSRRKQKKILVAEAAVAAASPVPILVESAMPYPYRLELERLDLSTGKVQWSKEYEHTFTSGATSVRAFGDHLFVYFSNHLLACMELSTGHFLWEEGSKHIGSASPLLPLQMANGWLIYSSGDVQAVDPVTKKEAWRIEDLGKVTGLFVRDGVAIAVGEKAMAAVDSANGTERWRKKTYGHTTNLVWDQEADRLLYADWKGLHGVERISGKALSDAPIDLDNPPYQLRMASLECVLAIGYHETSCYSVKTGKKLFSEGILNGVFRSEAFLDEWPLPESGQAVQRMVPAPSGDAEWEKIRRGTLLSADLLKNVEMSSFEREGLLDAYQTKTEEKAPQTKIWWVDGQTNRQAVIHPSAQQHDVSRVMGNVFAVDGKMLWAARIKEN